MRLNETNIKRLQPPATGNRVHYDDEVPGFGLRVTKAGARAFVLNYHVDGRERRLTLGSWPSWSATAARLRARELRKQVDQGVDPLGVKAERRKAPTFGDLADQYLEQHASKKKSGYRDEEYLRRDVLPLWGNRKAQDIEQDDVIELIDRKAQDGPIAANRLRAVIYKLFNWAISKRKGVAANPCVNTERPGVEKERDRTLSETEIPQFWSALDSARMSAHVRTILRLVLVTAQRPGEVCEIEYKDIEGEWWTVPAEKAKNRRLHRVPLVRLAFELLDPRASERWVFPSPRGDSPIQVNALTHALRRNKHLGLAPFTAHDLRRTAATETAKIGVPEFVIARVLNHAESERKVTKVYVRYSYDKEKRRALERWERKLRSIIGQPTGGKVVEFQR